MTTTNPAPEGHDLKVCPFCKQPPTVARVNFNQKVRIGCPPTKACPMFLQTPALPYPKAMVVWNTRAA